MNYSQKSSPDLSSKYTDKRAGQKGHVEIRVMVSKAEHNVLPERGPENRFVKLHLIANTIWLENDK